MYCLPALAAVDSEPLPPPHPFCCSMILSSRIIIYLQAIVQEALDRTMRNRTVLVIAHRLSTVQDAHRIVVIQVGLLMGMSVCALARACLGWAGGVQMRPLAHLLRVWGGWEECTCVHSPASCSGPGGGAGRHCTGAGDA